MYNPKEIYTPIKDGIKKGLQYGGIGLVGTFLLGTIANNTYGQTKGKVKMKFELFREIPYNDTRNTWSGLAKKDGILYTVFCSGLEAEMVDDYLDKGDTFEVMVNKKDFE